MSTVVLLTPPAAEPLELIETKAHLEFLRNEGCDEAQGYFLGRPMPVGLMFPQAAAVIA